MCHTEGRLMTMKNVQYSLEWRRKDQAIIKQPEMVLGEEKDNML